MLSLYTALSSTLIYNAYYGPTIGSTSDAVRTPFTPSKDAFQIWGVIYLGQVMYLMSHATKGKRLEHLYVANMRLNKRWLYHFANGRTKSALQTLRALVHNANQIVRINPENSKYHTTMMVYRTWLAVVLLQNELIVLQQCSNSAPAVQRTIFEIVHRVLRPS